MNSVKKLLVFAVALLVGFSACKKDEETEILNSIQGDVSFDAPTYAMVGDSFKLVATGTPDPSNVDYYWVCVGLRSDTLYAKEVDITIPDSLATFVVKLCLDVKDDKYYKKEISRNIISINVSGSGDKSIVGVNLPKDTFVDSRDGSTYATTEIGDLVWFAENLRYAGTKDAPLGYGYAKSEAIAQTVYGRLYTWQDATGGVTANGLGKGVQGACPEGWSIPTNEDWVNLATALNGGTELPFVNDWNGLGEKVIPKEATFNDSRIWILSGNTFLSDKYSWCAIAAGNCTNNYNNYSNIAKYGFWWSSTEQSAESANYRYIYYDEPDFPVAYTSKDGYGASVRCVKLINK